MDKQLPLESMPWYIAVPACILLFAAYFTLRHYQNKKEK